MTATDTELYSFGTLLKGFRKRRRLTQQELAGAIGVHRSAIVRWEQGDFLPQSKALVLELARCLHLDEQESRGLLEASLTALAPLWHVPLPRNPFFTGRKEVLEELHTHLRLEPAVGLTRSYALQGLGGIGKTQIALEYAYRHALDYRAVFWIGAETSENVVSSLLRVASVLGLPEREGQDQQRVLATVHRWLSTHSQWLLIWDNVEDLTLLNRFLPPARQGALLLTTRCQTLGTLARGIDLLPMQQEEGVQFLLRRAKVLDLKVGSEQMRQLPMRNSPQHTAVAELVRAMGGLPLALDQAGAYIEATHCSPQAYLGLFHARRAALLKLRGAGSHDHPESVSTTFALAITMTVKHHPAVQDLLCVCALLHPDGIPEELFRQGASHLGAQLEAIGRDELEWNQVMSIACSYSLLQRQPEEQTLSMHRLVRAVLLDGMTEEQRRRWTRRAVDALDAMLPEAMHFTASTSWQLCRRLLPHVLICVRRADATEETLALASLASKAAWYLWYLSMSEGYHEAEALLQRALDIRERILGSDHLEVALSLSHLGFLYRSQGKYAQAESLYQRALSIGEQSLGPNHLQVALPLNSLAVLYRDRGQYAEAKRLYQRALQINEQRLDPEHPEGALPLSNLADLYWLQGNYAEAEPLAQRALRIWEQAFGHTHPFVAYALINLAVLYRDQGQHEQAEALFQRAWYIREQGLGEMHPEVAEPLNGLAELYRMQGRYTEAERLFRHALHIVEGSLGHDHPLGAEPLTGLANLCRDQEREREAEVLYQQALALREQHLGQQHPETAQTLHDLALLRKSQGNLNEAISLAARTLTTRSQMLGDAHPKTIATRVLYTQLLQQQSDDQEQTFSEPAERRVVCSQGTNGQPGNAASILSKTSEPSPGDSDPLQGFLASCCELHPRAWCRSVDLWQAYRHWGENTQERYLLSRGMFIARLKALGCRADRTKTARIWRGIALVNKER